MQRRTDDKQEIKFSNKKHTMNRKKKTEPNSTRYEEEQRASETPMKRTGPMKRTQTCLFTEAFDRMIRYGQNNMTTSVTFFFLSRIVSMCLFILFYFFRFCVYNFDFGKVARSLILTGLKHFLHAKFN